MLILNGFNLMYKAYFLIGKHVKTRQIGLHSQRLLVFTVYAGCIQSYFDQKI